MSVSRLYKMITQPSLPPAFLYNMINIITNKEFYEKEFACHRPDRLYQHDYLLLMPVPPLIMDTLRIIIFILIK